jgi:galactose mutarotase-like enzyme
MRLFRRSKNQVDRWAHGQFVSIDNPKLEDPEAVVEVKIPELGTLIIDISPEYKKIWVWSMSDKDFVCIEPVMRDSNGLIDDPENIKPQETYSASVKFKLKES